MSHDSPPRAQEPLRILKVVHGFPPLEHAGAELCAYWLSQELLRRGHQVEVLAHTSRPEQPPYQCVTEDVDGIVVHRLRTPVERAGSLEQTYRDPRVAEWFRQELAGRFDLAHVHHLFGLSTDLIEVAESAGLPSIVTLHDFWYQCPRGQRFTPRSHLCAQIQPARCSLCIGKKRVRWAMNQAAASVQGGALRRPLHSLLAGGRYLRDNLALRPIQRRRAFVRDQLSRARRVISPSNFVLEEYRRDGLVGPAMDHSPNGVDGRWAEDLPAREAPHHPLRFGFVGSFLPSKGVDLLLEAFAGLAPGQASLHLHGTSPWDGGRYHDRLRARFARGDVHFHGRFARDQVAEVLAEVDVLVVPSRWYENAPVTLDEAALARLPVIASGIGGMKECVEARGNGLLFEVDDAVDLRRALRRFVDEPELWQQLRQPGQPVRTVAQQVDQLEPWYRELAGGAARA